MWRLSILWLEQEAPQPWNVAHCLGNPLQERRGALGLLPVVPQPQQLGETLQVAASAPVSMCFVNALSKGTQVLHSFSGSTHVQRCRKCVLACLQGWAGGRGASQGVQSKVSRRQRLGSTAQRTVLDAAAAAAAAAAVAVAVAAALSSGRSTSCMSMSGSVSSSTPKYLAMAAAVCGDRDGCGPSRGREHSPLLANA